MSLNLIEGRRRINRFIIIIFLISAIQCASQYFFGHLFGNKELFIVFTGDNFVASFKSVSGTLCGEQDSPQMAGKSYQLTGPYQVN